VMACLIKGQIGFNNIIEKSTMIKGIIEKIIMNTFGKFVKGIEKEKLSVDLFSGNFRLENIALNHDFFNSLNSPISLVFSSIGNLTLQVPHFLLRHPYPNSPQYQSNASSITSLSSVNSESRR
jgi:hypothetical protein